MLLSAVLLLDPLDEPAYGTRTRQFQRWFKDTVEACDPALFAHLHQDNAPCPYTLSGVTLPEGEFPAWLRITSLDVDLSALLRDRVFPQARQKGEIVLSARGHGAFRVAWYRRWAGTDAAVCRVEREPGRAVRVGRPYTVPGSRRCRHCRAQITGVAAAGDITFSELHNIPAQCAGWLQSQPAAAPATPRVSKLAGPVGRAGSVTCADLAGVPAGALCLGDRSRHSHGDRGICEHDKGCCSRFFGSGDVRGCAPGRSVLGDMGRVAVCRCTVRSSGFWLFCGTRLADQSRPGADAATGL